MSGSINGEKSPKFKKKRKKLYSTVHLQVFCENQGTPDWRLSLESFENDITEPQNAIKMSKNDRRWYLVT